MLSSTYQMSTAHDPRAAEIDPENRLLWRMNRRRLEAEAIRDSILAASGQFDWSMGGSLLKNKNHTYVTSTASANDVSYENGRRSIYLPVVRSAVYDVFQAFDFADPSSMNGKRSATTVAPQALFMMNSALVRRETLAMAEQLLTSPAADEFCASMAGLPESLQPLAETRGNEPRATVRGQLSKRDGRAGTRSAESATAGLASAVPGHSDVQRIYFCRIGSSP